MQLLKIIQYTYFFNKKPLYKKLGSEIPKNFKKLLGLNFLEPRNFLNMKNKKNDTELEKGISLIS